jgi:hypothetical protein
MKYWKTLPWFLLVATTAPAAGPDTNFVINGFGQDQCGQYVEAYQLGSSGYAPYISYLQGHASGLSQQTALRTGRTIDYMHGASIPSAALWLDNWCRQHPLQTFGEAAVRFLEETSGEKIWARPQRP